MHSTHVRVALLAAALLSPPALGAQALGDATVVAGPQVVSYKFGSGAAEKTVSQLAMPFAVIMPFGSRWTLDLSSSYAKADVKSPGGKSSSISGLTDTQLRGNLMLGDNTMVLTFGLNLPTGQYTVPEGQQEAAGQIGNDFLLYPVSSMGSGLATTGGIAAARTVGNWNVGFGGSFRVSSKFDAYQVASKVLRFTPGNEYRLRVGLDRPVGDGQVTLGLTYSKFGSDAADNTSYSTGDRALAQATLSIPVPSIPLAGAALSLTGWNLYRAAGQQIGGQSPWENVSDAIVGLGFRIGGLFIQPTIEGRFWQVAGNRAGTIANAGARLQFTAGALSFNPSVTYASGKLYSQSGGASTDVTGWKGVLLVRLH